MKVKGAVATVLASLICMFIGSGSVHAQLGDGTGILQITKLVQGEIPTSNWEFQVGEQTVVLPAAGGSVSLDLVIGEHTIAEVTKEGYVSSVTCNPGGETGTDSVTISIADSVPKDVVQCIFRNVQPNTITIIKNVRGEIPDSDWQFTVNGEPQTLDRTGDRVTLKNVEPGEYTIVETTKSGYGVGTVCDGSADGPVAGNESVTFTLAEGGAVECRFINSQFNSITVIKAVDGAPPESEWLFTGDLGNFSLPPEGGRIAFADQAAGTYTISETVHADFVPFAFCSTGFPGLASVTFTLSPGDAVVCTFINTRKPPPPTSKGTLYIEKVAAPADDTDFSFELSESGGVIETFQLDDADPNDGDAVADSTSFEVDAATDYVVKELSLPTGWSLESISCDGGQSEIDLEAASVTVNVPPNGIVSCTFTNTLPTGSITINKLAQPKDGTEFTFNSQKLGEFNLADGSVSVSSSRKFDNLVPGSYQIAEALPAGWIVEDIFCGTDSGVEVEVENATALIDLKPGEDVICNFINLKNGSINIAKSAEPRDGTDFVFVSDALGAFQLDHAEPDDNDGVPTGRLFASLKPGVYEVKENLPEGWSLQDITCIAPPDAEIEVDVPNATVTIALEAGQEVDCIFHNLKGGTITIEKTATPVDGTDFLFFGGDLGEFKLDHSDPNDGDDVFISRTFVAPPGSYQFSEFQADGWRLVDITCDDENNEFTTVNLATARVTIDLALGANIRCQFINARSYSAFLPQVVRD